MDSSSGGLVMRVSACMRCGAQNDTVHWRYPQHRGGVLVGVLCAACAERIEVDERARHAEANEQDTRP